MNSHLIAYCALTDQSVTMFTDFDMPASNNHGLEIQTWKPHDLSFKSDRVDFQFSERPARQRIVVTIVVTPGVKISQSPLFIRIGTGEWNRTLVSLNMCKSQHSTLTLDLILLEIGNPNKICAPTPVNELQWDIFRHVPTFAPSGSKHLTISTLPIVTS